MVIACVKLEGAPVIEGIKILKVRKLRRDGDRPFLARLAIENSDLVAMRFQRSSQIGQTDRLRPYRCLVEISDGRLNEEDLHLRVSRVIGLLGFIGFVEFVEFVEFIEFIGLLGLLG
jgi:hypothetical protein